jgi:hypothetical protein
MRTHHVSTEVLGKGHGVNGLQKFVSQREKGYDLILLKMLLMLPCLIIKLQEQCTVLVPASIFWIIVQPQPHQAYV